MLIAGEASGDLLAAELVEALRQEFAEKPAPAATDSQPLHASLAPRFFGAGGPRMAAAGVEVAFDMTAHSVIGLSAALKKYLLFRRLFFQLLKLALERQPDVIICVDFAYFNRRFAQAIRQHVRGRTGWFQAWHPHLVQYVSPQVWASREGRAYPIARDFDLLLSIFPFEKEWYVKRVPKLHVEFVGHPLVGRYTVKPGPIASEPMPTVLLLPGSRPGELGRHLPVLAETAKRIAAARKVMFQMVLPHESLREQVRPFENEFPQLELQIGRLPEALSSATVAITKSGTITLECAFFGVPAVVFYKTSLVTYLVGKQVVKVKHIAMPNLLAKEAVYPEFIQGAATAENLARATLELLDNPERRAKVKAKLAEIVAQLGGPRASRRAAKAIMDLIDSPAN
jgi:lipid-A-disaccharide synthase